MPRLSFHRLAVCELDEAAHYYESRSTGLGTVFVNAVEACAESIRALPNSGRVMRGKIRRRLVRGFPYAPETFRDFISWLADGGYSAIALRDLGRYFPPPAPPADPYAARRRRHGTRFGPPHLR